ncbi:MAG: hypothetical protein ACJA2M_000601 [Polaribacter sp.]|jgi:hypothetical protein
MRNLNLKSIKGSLSREEMRTINGGGLSEEECKNNCPTSGCRQGEICVSFHCVTESGIERKEYVCMPNFPVLV